VIYTLKVHKVLLSSPGKNFLNIIMTSGNILKN